MDSKKNLGHYDDVKFNAYFIFRIRFCLLSHFLSLWSVWKSQISDCWNMLFQIVFIGGNQTKVDDNNDFLRLSHIPIMFLSYASLVLLVSPFVRCCKHEVFVRNRTIQIWLQEEIMWKETRTIIMHLWYLFSRTIGHQNWTQYRIPCWKHSELYDSSDGKFQIFGHSKGRENVRGDEIWCEKWNMR